MIHDVASCVTLPWMPRKKVAPSEKKVPIAARVDPSLRDWVESVAADDERTVSFMIEKALRVLREHMATDAKKSKR